MAKVLQSAMDEKGWGPTDTAREAGVSYRTVARILTSGPNDPWKPWRSTLSKLARALDRPGLVDYHVKPSPEDIDDRLSEVEEALGELRAIVLQRLGGAQPTSD